jgi:hypothetical protein
MADAPDNRQHHRFRLTYPIRLISSRGHEMAASETVNVSRSGAFIVIPVQQMPEPGEILNVSISVPDQHNSGQSLGEFVSEASVVRHHPRDDDSTQGGVALSFAEPLTLIAGA